MDTTLFQYCQKIVLFDETFNKVLLAKRKGEADFDGVFSFIGGKMESTDEDFSQGLKREKDEEIGTDARVIIYPSLSINEYFIKRNGQPMALPHHLAIYVGGDITINDEYSEYAWVDINELERFEPKIETVHPMVKRMLNLKDVISIEKSVEI